jgi:hypothetical protein
MTVTGPNTAVVVIQADGTQFSPAMKAIEAAATRTADTIERNFNKAANSGVDRLNASLMKVQNIIGMVVSGYVVKDIVGAALEQDRALTTLAASYKQAGIYSGELMTSTQALASEMQMLVNVDDDVIEKNIALMMNIGHLSADQIPAATRAAIGLSDAFQKDMKSAFETVGKAAAGNTGRLKNFGIILDEGLTKQEKFNRVLEIGARGFEGLKEKSKDATGQYERLGIQIGELKEAAGAFAASNPMLWFLKTATRYTMELTDILNNLGITAKITAVDLEEMSVIAMGAAKGTTALVIDKLPFNPIIKAIPKLMGFSYKDLQADINSQLKMLEESKLRFIDKYEAKKGAKWANVAPGGPPLPSPEEDLSTLDKQIEKFEKDAYNRYLFRKPLLISLPAPLAFMEPFSAPIERFATPPLGMAAAEVRPPEFERFGAPKYGMGAENWYDIEQKNRVEDLALARDHGKELIDIQNRTFEQQIMNTATGFDRERKLKGLQYDIDRDQLVSKYGEGSAAVEALAKLHSEEMIGINRDEVDQMAKDSLRLTSYWADTFLSMYEQADGNFSKIGAAFEKMIEGMMVKAAVYGIINMLTGGAGGFMGGVKSTFSFLGRASGGPVEAYTPYLVGERGMPEIFVPKTSGDIYPMERQSERLMKLVMPAPLKIPFSGKGESASRPLERQSERLMKLVMPAPLTIPFSGKGESASRPVERQSERLMKLVTPAPLTIPFSGKGESAGRPDRNPAWYEGPRYQIQNRSETVIRDDHSTTIGEDHSTVTVVLPAGEKMKVMDARRFAELYNQAKRDGYIRKRN